MLPLAGSVTVTGTVAGVAMADPGIVASSFEELTKLVCSGTPLKLTTAPDTKFVPSTSSWNPAEPAVMLAGLSWEMAGEEAFGLEYPHPRPRAVTLSRSNVLYEIFTMSPRVKFHPDRA